MTDTLTRIDRLEQLTGCELGKTEAALALGAMTDEPREWLPGAQRDMLVASCNELLAALEKVAGEVERLKTEVVQTHIYRLPVIAVDIETGEQGVHWIDGLSAAEVFAVLRGDSAPVYESVPEESTDG